MHPFLEGLSKHRAAPPTIIVIFGASGDLTARKLIPALYNLALDNLLPPDTHLIGYGRQPIPDDSFRQHTADAIARHSRRDLNPALWEHLARNTHYHTGDYDNPGHHAELLQKIAGIETRIGRPAQTLCYISTPPQLFAPIIQNIGASGLAKRHHNTPLHTKVIIEKPFGRSLATAQQLNATLAQTLDENQIYRIDHYLGKETVQDLLVQRFANATLEPLWNRDHIDAIQITVAETDGVGTRAQYYDHSGALRDMIQNHTMQLLALTAMEPPPNLDPESIRNEKVRLLQSIRPLQLTNNNTGKPPPSALRAQYAAGMLSGQKLPAYTAEKNVPPDSLTETYAALRLEIDNPRWRGVPVYLRTGKRLPRRVTEIALQFKTPSPALFPQQTPNTLAFEIQPDEGLTLILNTKVPGLETRLQPVRMNFRHNTTFGSNTPEAYERLILDAMVNDNTLFIRGDETETSWRLCTPVLEQWASEPAIETYPAGTWGPKTADQLLTSPAHHWRQP